MAIPIAGILSTVISVIPTLWAAFKGGGSTDLMSQAISLLGNFLNKPGASPAEIERDLMQLEAYKLVELKRLEYSFKLQLKSGEQALEQMGMLLAAEQAKINQLDAMSDDKYRTRWRPTMAWALTGGIVVYMLLVFTLVGCMAFDVTMSSSIESAFKYLEGFSLSFMMPLITAILGLGAFRTYEKTKGVG